MQMERLGVSVRNSDGSLRSTKDVLFDVAKYELKENAKQSLDSLAESIRQVDKATILVEGHTDSDGDDN